MRQISLAATIIVFWAIWPLPERSAALADGWKANVERAEDRKDIEQVKGDASRTPLLRNEGNRWKDKNLDERIKYPKPEEMELGFGGAQVFISPEFQSAVNEKGEPNYRLVRVFFATNRELVTKGGSIEALAKRGGKTSFGFCDVSVPADHRLGNIESAAIWRFEFGPQEKEHIILRGVAQQVEKLWSLDLSSHVKGGGRGRVLLFVHGFANTFRDAARRSAQLKYDLGFEGPTVFYSWPSKGSVLNYIADRTSVEASRTSLANFVSALTRIDGVQEVLIVAHSMGAKLVAEALQKVSQTKKEEKRISEIILAAPDIDKDVFINDLAPLLKQVSSRVTIYASGRDRAMEESRSWNGEQRVGSTIPEPIVWEGIETIDASAVDTSFWGHSYYGDNQSVVGDIYHIVQSRLPADNRPNLVRAIATKGTYWRIESRQ